MREIVPTAVANALTVSDISLANIDIRLAIQPALKHEDVGSDCACHGPACLRQSSQMLYAEVVEEYLQAADGSLPGRTQVCSGREPVQQEV